MAIQIPSPRLEDQAVLANSTTITNEHWAANLGKKDQASSEMVSSSVQCYWHLHFKWHSDCISVTGVTLLYHCNNLVVQGNTMSWAKSCTTHKAVSNKGFTDSNYITWRKAGNESGTFCLTAKFQPRNKLLLVQMCLFTSVLSNWTMQVFKEGTAACACIRNLIYNGGIEARSQSCSKTAISTVLSNIFRQVRQWSRAAIIWRRVTPSLVWLMLWSANSISAGDIFGPVVNKSKCLAFC